jgi:hypothetical protein
LEFGFEFNAIVWPFIQASLNKQTMLKKTLMGVVVTLGIVFLVGNLLFPPVWISPEIRTRVVDEAGKPVQGAVVVLNWQLYQGMHGWPEGSLATLEAVTDINGEFIIPKWGPMWTERKGLRPGEPSTHIFHESFEPLSAGNTLDSRDVLKKPWVFIRYYMNGKTYSLKSFKGSPEENEKQLMYFSDTLKQVIDRADPCAWTRMPRMISGVYKVRRELQKKQAGFGLLDITRLEVAQKGQVCGDPKEVLKQYLE